MAADPLGGRGDHDVGAVVDRAADVAGGAEGVVDDERDAVVVGDLGERLEVGHVEARVADRLDVERPRARVDRLREVRRVVAVDELHADAEAREGDLELVVGAAVEVARRDDVVAGLQDRREREELRRLAARGGERGDAALERGDALLEDVGRRVHDPGVDVPELLQREEARAVVGVVERVGRGLVDRDGAGVRARARAPGRRGPAASRIGSPASASLIGLSSTARRRRAALRFRRPVGNKKPAPALPLRVFLATVTSGCRSA